MSRHWWEFFKQMNDEPAKSLRPAQPVPSNALPRTYLASSLADGSVRPRLFDPALCQFPSAFRSGDPTFKDQETALRWAMIRRSVTDHVLTRIAESKVGDFLILRGSRLLRAWLGDQAREPGDLDWIADLGPIESSKTYEQKLFDVLIEAVVAPPLPDSVELMQDLIATDEIWTYDRAPGRRVVFPWRAGSLPGGSVQVDVVFEESLHDPDDRVLIPAADGSFVSVRAASPAQSLAWKLVWLDTDMHAQGKDLFDAVLLAERFTLSKGLLEASLAKGGGRVLPATAADFLKDWSPDWENFLLESPWVIGDVDHWMERLEVALKPTFEIN